MGSYKKFKQVIGYSGDELEKFTGYTRQGLHCAFGMIDAGKEPSRQFIVCINAALNQRIEEETRKYNEKVKQLRELQEEYKND